MSVSRSLSCLGAVLLFSSVAACATSEGVESSASNLTEDGPAAHFRAGAEPTWSGDLTPGSTLAIDYDFARLPTCRNQSSLVSWVVEVNWRFDGGAIHTAALPGSPGAGETSSTIDIPESAHSIELWFENRAVGGYDHCDSFDSRFGENYKHAF